MAQASFADDREPAQESRPDLEERGMQMRAAHTMNLRFSPIVAFVRIVDVNFDYGITPHITIGPKLTYIDLKPLDVSLQASAIGIEGRYHFTQAFADGAYMSALLGTLNLAASVRSSATGENLTATGSGINYALGIGYHWFWQSFNLNLGLTVGGTSIGKLEVKDSTGTTVESANSNLSSGLDFKIGFAF